MAFLFADSFDPYGSVADLTSRYATVAAASGMTLVGATGTAFGSGQAITASGGGNSATATFASNETTMFGSLRLKWASASGASGCYFWLTFQDGASNQCTLRWNGDGSISLYAGSATGTLLQNFAGVFSLNTWDSWQFKVVVNSATGSVELRKNGGGSDIINLGSVNTRAGSTNSYANAITYGWYLAGNVFVLDDLFLCSGSGAAPNSWTGDIRSVQQVPNGQAQAQFAIGPSQTTTWGSTSTGATLTLAANTVLSTSPGTATAPTSGSATALTCLLVAGFTGNLKLALYDASGPSGGPGNLIGSTVEIVNPIAGYNTANLVAPITIVSGVNYYMAILANATASVAAGAGGSAYHTLAAPYSGGFPASMAASSIPANSRPYGTVTMTLANSNQVGEVAEDGDTSYVSSSTVGQEDIYTLSSIPSTCTVTGVNYYAMWKKADAGARTAALSVAANGSADTTEVTNAALSDSYTYGQAFLTLDPTGAAWTPTAINAAQLGIKVSA